MKLTYRGHAYSVPALIQLDSASTDQLKIKLIYRRHAYDYTPRTVVVPKAVVTDEPTVTLIYRGNSYERDLQALKAY